VASWSTPNLIRGLAAAGNGGASRLL
jgi:hypothetical protein